MGHTLRTLPMAWHERSRIPAWTIMTAGLLTVVLGLAALSWPRPAHAATVWCDDGINSGSGWSARVTSYADPGCGNVNKSFFYDHYDYITSGQVVNIWLDYARAWRCGTLVYYTSDGAGSGINASTRNIPINWISGYSTNCYWQSDHRSRYFKSGVINTFGYVNENSS